MMPKFEIFKPYFDHRSLWILGFILHWSLDKLGVIAYQYDDSGNIMQSKFDCLLYVFMLYYSAIIT